MLKIDKKIEIVRSTNKGLSSMSDESAQAILSVLNKNYSNASISIVNDIAGLEKVVRSRPDLVFIGMEFIPSSTILDIHDPNKIWITDYLDKFNIYYTGSGARSHEAQRNKHQAKKSVLKAGLDTAPFFVAKQKQLLVESDVIISYPVFVKPTNRGGGAGIDSQSIVHNFEQLVEKVKSIASIFHADSLVEEYLSGREFSVAVLRNTENDDYDVMPIELIAPDDGKGLRILSSKVKSANAEEVLFVNNSILKAEVCDLAIGVFHALGASDYGRIDIRMDDKDKPYFLEANLIPSLIAGYGSFPKASLLNTGLQYEDMILKIVELGLMKQVDGLEVNDANNTELEVVESIS